MTIRVVARNALSLLSANVMTAGVGFAVTVLLVRYLGVERLGAYTYVTTYAALFGILSNFGLYLVLTRQVAGESGEASVRLGSVLLLQGLLALPALTITVGSAFLFHPGSEILPIALCAIGVVLASVASTYGAVITGKEKIYLNAAVSVGMAVLWGLLVLGLIALQLGVLGLIALFVIHKLVNVMTLRLICQKACGVAAASRPAVAVAPAPAAGSEAPWRADLTALKEEIRTELRPSAAPEPLPASAASRRGRTMTDEEWLARVRQLIEASETRSHREMALGLAAVVRHIDTQPRADMRRVADGLGVLEGRSGAVTAQQREMMNYLLRVLQR